MSDDLPRGFSHLVPEDLRTQPGVLAPGLDPIWSHPESAEDNGLLLPPRGDCAGNRNSSAAPLGRATFIRVTRG
jgi:hypothetical protein